MLHIGGAETHRALKARITQDKMKGHSPLVSCIPVNYEFDAAFIGTIWNY